MAPKIYQGRGEAAQKTDVPRKKIDAQNSTEAGVMRSLINDYFSVDYLAGVQEYPAQILRVLKEGKEYRNFRENSTSLLGKITENIAQAFGIGKQRYIVRVFAVDIGIPAPDDFGSDSANTINDAIIELHAHHEMVPYDDGKTYKVGDIVVVKFNNNTERTDGVIVRKTSDAPEKNNSPTPDNSENYGNPSAQYNNQNTSISNAPGTIGCAAPNDPQQTSPQPVQAPSETIKKQLEDLQKKNIILEEQMLEYSFKIKALNSKSTKTAQEEALIINYNTSLLPLEEQIQKNKEEYSKLADNLNSIELQKQEIKIKIEATNNKEKQIADSLKEIDKKINSFPVFKNSEQELEIINLRGEKNFQELQAKSLGDILSKLLDEQKKLDASPSIRQQEPPAPPPSSCTPQNVISNIGENNKKYPTSEERLTLIKSVVKGCRAMGFTNTNFIAAVCANIEKETGWKIRNESDYGGTSATRLRVIFSKRLSQFNDQQLYELAFRNEEFYDYIYGYKTQKGLEFENTEPGDGYKYRGRGFVGYTGKGLYKKASMAIFKDDRLVKNPDMANEPEINGKFLGYYLSTTIGKWEKILGVNRNTVTQEQACALITSAVGGVNILQALEKERAAGKTINDGIWTQIFTKVKNYFPKYIEEASKQ